MKKPIPIDVISRSRVARQTHRVGAALSPPQRAGAASEAIHTLPTPDVYAALSTRPAGLTQAEAAERLQRYGRNVIREIKGTPLIVKFLANFTHMMAILLWAGGLAAFFAQMPQLGIAIWMVNLINGAFGFWQEYRAEQATAALKRLLPHYARVLREGIVATQVGAVFGCRTNRASIFTIGLFTNQLVLVGVATELIILGLLIYTPLLQNIFNTAPIGLREWMFVFAWTPIIFLADEVRKALLRWRERRAAGR
jgi:magnesium-transporting ATPase (P-type)